ncbi:MAG: hypothetical protein ACR2LY_03720 [Thermoleophilaceae bacterium]
MSGLSGGDDGGSNGGGRGDDGKGGKKGNGKSNGNGNGKRADDDSDGGDPPALGGVVGSLFRNDCGVFRRNFNTAPKQAQCAVATRQALIGVSTPAQACQGFRPRRARGFRRSDRVACVRAIQLSQAAVARLL